MTIKITPNEKGNPPGKLAEAEPHSTEAPLHGLKLIGFSVWERRGGNRRNVTFPARQYSVDRERRASRCSAPSSTPRLRTSCAIRSSRRFRSTDERAAIAL